MTKTMTVREIESAKPRDKEYKLTIDRGLYIRVATNGVKTWLVRYVVNGKQFQYRLPKPFGISSDGSMSLAEAKRLNANIQALAKDGIDYQVQQEDMRSNELDIKKAKEQARKEEEAKNLTFKDLYDVWIKDGVARADGNELIIRTFKIHAMPILGNIPLRALSESNLLEVLRTVIDNGKTTTAIMLHKSIKQMLKWAEIRKPYRALLIDGNPSDLINIENLIPSDYEEVRTRALSIEEIKSLDDIFKQSEITYEQAPNKYEAIRPVIKETQLALWICLGTLSRIGETLTTEWEHVDFEKRTWYIPKENVKGTRRNKQAQLVYLSDFTLDKFKQLHEITKHSKWAFPASDDSINKSSHVNKKSVTKQVGDRQAQFKQLTKNLTNRVNNNTLVLGEEKWTPHDMRRTGATLMQKLKDPKISRDVINLCQNHEIGTKIDRVYLLDDYADEKKEAWYRLGDYLEALLSADNVVSINSAKVA